MSTPITTREDLTRIQWFAMSAYKNEKKAEEMLKGKDGLEYFIPKHYAVRVYHGVKSKRLVPVIPNLVFVHASRKQITDFKKKYNFLQFMMWEKSTGLKYIVVPDKQMEDFMFVMDLNPDGVSLNSEILTVGHKVKVIKGEFSGIEGEVAIEANKTYVVIRIKDLLTASVKVPKSYLKIIG